MNIKGLLAAATVAVSMPFSASAISFSPTDFPVVYDDIGDRGFQIITLSPTDVGSGAGFFDLIFDVALPLSFLAEFTLVNNNVAGSATPFQNLAAHFISNPDTTSFTPTTGTPIDTALTSNETGGFGNTTVTLANGGANNLSLIGTGFTPNPGTITPAAGDNYALRFVYDDIIASGSFTVELTAIPLPAGMVLLITGLAGLGFVSHRRKQASA